jgi:type IV pilus assembly protein PilN
MAKINLLPWREERRKQRNREATTLFGATAFFAVIVVFVIIWQAQALIDDQKARNGFLEKEIKELDAKIKEIEALEATRSKLLARKAVIEQLQASRSHMVHLFDDLVRTIPDGVRLNAIRQSGDTLTLEGVAESNARVSTYMRNLEASPWVTNPDLDTVEATGPDKRNRYAFTLRVQMKKPKVEGEEGGDEAAPAAAAPKGAS